MTDINFDTLLGNEPPPDGGADFDALLRADNQNAKTQRMREVQQGAQAIDPDRQVKALDIAGQHGMPVSAAYDHIDDLTKPTIDYDALLKNSPATADLLGHPDKGPVAKDDHEALAGVEGAVKGLAPPLDYGGAPGQYKGSPFTPEEQAQIDALRASGPQGPGVLRWGNLTPEQGRERQKADITDALRLLGEAGSIADQLHATAIPDMAPGAPGQNRDDPFPDWAIEQALKGTRDAGAANVEALAHNVPTQTTLRDAVDRIGSAIVGGAGQALQGAGALEDMVARRVPGAAPLVALRVAAENIVSRGTWAARPEGRSWLDKIGGDIANKLAPAMFPGDKSKDQTLTAQLSSAMGSMLMFIGAGGLARGAGIGAGLGAGLLGGATQAGAGVQDARDHGATQGQQDIALLFNAIGGATEAVPVEGLFNSIFREGRHSLAKFFTAAAKSFAQEGGQEAVQSVVQDVPAALMFDPNRDVLGNALTGFFVGGLSGGVFGGLAHLASSEAMDHRDQLLSLARHIQNSKVAERSPAMTADLISKVNEMHGGPAEVTASSEAVTTLLQEMPPDQIMRDMPRLVKSLTEAAATGAEVSIPTEYMARLAKLQGFNAFVEDVRVRPDDYTPREHKAAVKEIEASISKMEIADPPAPSPVYDDILRQLVAAGQSPDVARQNAALHDAVITTQAERAGVTPETLMRRYGFEVTSDVVTAEKLAPQLDALRAELTARAAGPKPVKAPRLAKVGPDYKPTTILEFIAEKGGIRDDHNELAHRGVNHRNSMTRYGPWFRKRGEAMAAGMFGGRSYIRGKGMSPDMMREALVEAGFLHDAGNVSGGNAETTTDDVYALIDRALRGETVAAVGDVGTSDRAVQDANQELLPRFGPDERKIIDEHGYKAGAAIAKFFEDNGMAAADWLPEDVALAAKLIDSGVGADEAFERAAVMNVEGDWQDLAPASQSEVNAAGFDDATIEDIANEIPESGANSGQGGTGGQGQASQGVPATDGETADTGRADKKQARLAALRSTIEAAGIKAADLATMSNEDVVKALAAHTLNQEVAPPFYSALLRSIEGMKQEKAPAAQWMGMVRNAPGVKAEEVAWLGLEDWLKAQSGPITKAAIADYLRANQVQVQEVVKGKTADDRRAEIEAIPPEDRTLQQANELSDIEDGQWSGEPSASPSGTKFSDYQLPGGHNYRELLLTLPIAPSTGGEVRAGNDPTHPFDIVVNGNVVDRAETAEKAMRALEWAMVAYGKENKLFKSSHFDEPNILAHVRFNERIDADGKKVLFVEEIQSDWHQKGRKQGYRGADTDPKIIEALRDKSREAQDAVVSLRNSMPAPQTMDEASDNADRLIEAGRVADQAREAWHNMQREAKSGVPDAPFKTTWPELSFKRMIRYAAENGFDKIAWTTGETQAERYDLSKQIDEVRYGKSKDGKTVTIDAVKGGSAVMSKVNLPMSELEDVVGKELAEKIDKGEGEVDPQTGSMRLSGLDLKVGGKGMTGFYDKMLVDVANKLGKKFGAKVGATEIVSDKMGWHITPPTHAVSGKWMVKSSDYNSKGLMFDTEAEAKASLEEKLGKARVHSMALPPDMRDAAMQGQALFQDARGFITFGPARDKFKVTLTGKANLSTFLHESGHFFLEVLQDLTSRGEASQQQHKDLQAIREWAGIENGKPIDVKTHEQFARGFEAYLMEGKAPSLAMNGVFQKFKAWLLFVYRRMTALNVTLSDEIRGVMDRLVASDAAIAEARAEIGLGAAPMTQDALALTDAEYRTYVEAWIKSHDAQSQEADARVLAEAARETKVTWQAEKLKVTAEIEAELAKTPGYVAWKAIDAFESKIQADSVPADLQKMAAGLMTDKGIPLDFMAEMQGYESGQAMLQAIAGARLAQKNIGARVRQVMTERHGEMGPDGLATEAMKAVHTKPTAKVILSEYRALAANAGIKTQKGTLEFLANVAAQRVAVLTKRQLDPVKWRRAELRAATEAGRLAAQKKPLEASIAKRQQLLAHAMERASQDALDRVETIRDYLTTFLTNRRRALLGKAGDLYLDGIDQILEGIEFKNVSLKALNKRPTLQSIVDQALAADEPINIPPELLGAGVKNYSQMTMEELEGVHDAVKNLWTLAKLKNTLVSKRGKMELDAAMKQAAATAERELGMRRGQDTLNPSWRDRAVNRIRWVRAQLVKMEFLFGWLDGQDSGGLVHSLMYQPIADARHAEYGMMKDMTALVLDRIGAMPAEQKTRWNTYRKFMNLEHPVRGANIIAVALNLGNEGNKDKLLRGYKWTEPQLMAEIDAFMTKEDWDMVQHIWDSIDTLWPHIERVAKNATGLPPPKVVPVTVETRHGDYRGGYYPVVYDPLATQKQAEHQEKNAAGNGLFANNFLRPSLANGFTKERTKYAAPILLDLNVLSQHLAETIHYVTHYEAVKQADKIRSHPVFQKLVTDTMGKEFYREIRPWLQDIANNTMQRRYPELGEAVMRRIRAGVSLGAMGYSVTTAAKQLLGIVTSLDAIGPRYWASGVAKSWTSPKAAANWRFALQNSKELAPLIRDFDRDVKFVNDAYTQKIAGGVKDAMLRHAFALTGYFQLAVNVATWHGGYEQAVADGKTDSEAFDIADSIVRKTQGSGAIKDLANVQRSGEATKLVTMFYSYMSVLYNRLEDIHRETKGIYDIPRAARRLAVLALLPSILNVAAGDAYKAMFPPDDGSEDDQPFLTRVLLESADLIVGTVPVLRSFVNFKGWGGQFSPAIAKTDQMKRAGSSIWDWVTEGQMPSRKEWRTIVDVTGVVTLTPGAAVYKLADDIFGESISEALQ